MKDEQQHLRVTMYYDGGCPLCAREVKHYKKVDKAKSVNWVDIDHDDSVLRSIGVTREAAMQRLHVTDRQGKLFTGAFAFHVIWSELPGYRWLARAVSPRPVLLIADAAYNWFARHRYSRRCKGSCSVEQQS